jgi:hypothetical protein
MTEATFSHVGAIGEQLSDVHRLLDALALLTETMEEPHAGAANVIVWTTIDHLREIDLHHTALFRLNHPDRDFFERVGWPTGDEIIHE